MVSDVWVTRGITARATILLNRLVTLWKVVVHYVWPAVRSFRYFGPKRMADTSPFDAQTALIQEENTDPAAIWNDPSVQHAVFLESSLGKSVRAYTAAGIGKQLDPVSNKSTEYADFL